MSISKWRSAGDMAAAATSAAGEKYHQRGGAHGDSIVTAAPAAEKRISERKQPAKRLASAGSEENENQHRRMTLAASRNRKMKTKQ